MEAEHWPVTGYVENPSLKFHFYNGNVKSNNRELVSKCVTFYLNGKFCKLNLVCLLTKHELKPVLRIMQWVRFYIAKTAFKIIKILQ